MKDLFRILISITLLTLIGCASSGGGGDDNGIESDVTVTPIGNKLAETNVKLGVGYFQQGNYEYALIKFRKAIDIDDSLPSAHYAIALLYDKLGKPQTARKHFVRAIEIDPAYSDAHNAFGAFLCDLGEYDKAEKSFLKALKNPLFRSKALVHTNAGICAVKAKSHDRAEKHLRILLQANPKNAVALYNMALVNFESQQYLQARAYSQRYSAVAKATPQTLWLGARIERKLGDKNAIARYGFSLKQLFPDSNEAKLFRDSQ